MGLSGTEAVITVNGWAFVFPGQGAQEVGMGKALAAAYPAAMNAWLEAEQTLDAPIREIAWNGTADELARTNVTQPALLTAEVAALRVIEAKGVAPIAVAGHSLGEYAALVAAGALDFADALRVVRARGDAMQSVAETAGGGMVAVIGADLATLEAICAEIGGIAPANINAPGQVVVSGSEAGLNALESRASEVKARRILRLNVAGPFHSPFMAPAAEAVAEALSMAIIREPKIPVYANVTAAPQTTAEEIRANLIAQVTGRVRWEETVRRLVARGASHILELGPGSVLAGLIRRIHPEVAVHSVGDPVSLCSFMESAS